MYHYKDREEK